MGGTWDLFRYPGIRSDSDMYTLGYNFKPWKEGKAIADGPSILNYIRETASEADIDRHIRYQHTVTSAKWSSEDAAWTVAAHDTATDETVTIRCNFLLMCSGYYNYEQGYLPEFKGRDRFRGETVHPQHWPEDLDYSGKQGRHHRFGRDRRDAGPGDGQGSRARRDAAALTHLHGLDAGHRLDSQAVAMAAAGKDGLCDHPLEEHSVPALDLLAVATAPQRIRKKLLKMARKELGKGVDFDKHFVPRYDPWDQRLCLVPNGDFFHAIRDGRASVVTDTIAEFTENGIRLESGQELEADIIVTATGLDLCVLGDVQISVDDQASRHRRDLFVQVDDVLRCAEPGFDVRLHQRVVDAESRPHGRVLLPPAQSHDRYGYAPVHAALAG